MNKPLGKNIHNIDKKTKTGKNEKKNDFEKKEKVMFLFTFILPPWSFPSWLLAFTVIICVLNANIY